MISPISTRLFLTAALAAMVTTTHREFGTSTPCRTQAAPAPASATTTPTEIHLQEEKHRKVLGIGANGLVRRATALPSEKPVAVKLVKRNSLRLKQEITILTKLQRLGGHPNIVPFYGVVANDLPEYPEQCGLVFEIFPGGEVYETVVKRGIFSEREARHLVQQIVAALAFLHENGIVHGDIKPENILCKTTPGRRRRDEVDYAICDFGSARLLDEQGRFLLQPREPIGTIPYLAPEAQAVTSEPVVGTRAMDIFSLGVLLFVLLSGQLPFDDPQQAAAGTPGSRRNEEIVRRILHGEFTFDEQRCAAWRNVSAEAKDLIRRMLERDPARRITASEVMAHDWLATTTTTQGR